MALSKIASELIQKLGTDIIESVAKPDLGKKTTGRTPTKGKAPEQIIDDRVSDIQRETQENNIKQAEIQKRPPPVEKVLKEQIAPSERPDSFGNKVPLTEEQVIQNDNILKANQKKEDFNNRLPEMQERIKELKRNKYLNSLTLKKEQELTKNVKLQQEKGIRINETLLDMTSIKIGVGRPFSTIESRNKAIYNELNRDMFDVNNELRTKTFGLTQNRDLADDVHRYLEIGKTKNPKNTELAKVISEQWTKSSEMTRKLRNQAGARIGRLEDWILPQSHDKSKIKKVGYDKWVQFIKPKMDAKRIETEQNAPIDTILKSAYDSITSHTIVKGTGKGKQLAKRGELERILHFKRDGESAIAYKNMFGNPDIFATMQSHLRRQSNEIATMQIFGPNPEVNFEKMKELARSEELSGWSSDQLDDQWKVSTGQADEDTINGWQDRVAATLGSINRGVSVGAFLGTAPVSGLSDLANIFIGGGYRGLSSIKMAGKGLNTMLQEAMSIGSVGKNTEIANRIGVVSEFASGSISNDRYAEQATGFFQKTAEVVIRGTGLSTWTNSLRVSFGLELAGKFYDDFSKGFSELKYNDMFTEYGITSEQWDTIRSTAPRIIKGNNGKAKNATFLDLRAVSEKDQELGYRLSEMISSEMDAFVINSTDRTRRYATGGATKGSAKGEVRRNLMAFNSFPVTIAMMHINRIGQMTTLKGKVAYIAGGLVASTIMGGISVQAYDFVTGKTPRDIFRWQYLIESLLKGGALGKFGDIFLGEDVNKYGNSWAAVAGGVTMSNIQTISKMIGAMFGADEKSIPAVYNTAVQYIPGQNAWMTRWIMESTIGDFIGNIVDPERQAKRRRREKFLRLRGQKRRELFEN